MPILKDSTPKRKEYDGTKQTDEPKVTHPDYRTPVVDTRYKQRRSLLTHVEGSSWKVNYYQQVLEADSELAPQQVNKSGVYQQYFEILGLEIKVTDPLSSSQDIETGSFEVTGSAIIYPTLIPNVGDMFIADVGDGREGIFSITESERLSILNDPCYRVNYVLVAQDNQSRHADLKSKTIKTTHFVRKRLEHGEDPLLVTEDYHRNLSMEEHLQDLRSRYFPQFFSKSIATLEVPGQDCVTYDPFLARAILETMDENDHPLIRQMRPYSADLPGLQPPVTVWDAVKEFDAGVLPMASEQLALVDSRYFGVIPQYESVFFSKIEDVVYPQERIKDCHPIKLIKRAGLVPRDIRHQFRVTDLGSIEETMKDDEQPLIHQVTEDGYYIFTEAFYFEDSKKMSRMEWLLRQSLGGNPVDQKLLLDLCEAQQGWGLLERFYYTPFLMILIKMVLQGS